jgi:carbon monoxide dehydrogenase subunit G
MKISGTASLAAPPEKVWDAFHDPGSLARCLPGCESLTEIGPHQYAMTVTAGVAAIKGTYDGQVALTEQQHPGSFTLKAKGAGAPGTVDADVKVRLAPSANGGTDLTYDADAAVGGVIGGVGQRMLAGVTKKMAGQFFTAVDNDIAGVPVAPVPAPAGVPAGVAPAAAGVPAPPVYAGAPAAAARAAVLDKGFAAGVGLGALIALVGVAVGAAIGRRR